MNKRLLAWLLLGAITPGSLGAAEDILAASNSAFPSVQQGASARAIGMGSTYVGIAEGSAALLWNPAGLGGLQAPEVALHHDSTPLGGMQDIAVLGLPLGCDNALGMSVTYEDNGSFEGRDLNGVVTGSYAARAYGASLGWGIGGATGLSLGLAVKAEFQDLAGSTQSGFAGDAGVLYSFGPALTLGAAYTNLGPDSGGHPLAQGARVGLSSYAFKGSDYQWLFAASVESLTDGDSSLHFGVEHTLYRLLALRAGYAFDVTNPDPGGLVGWTFGGGLVVGKLNFDYAFVPLADLGNMQRVSVTYAFGAPCSPIPAATPRPTPVRTPEATPQATLRPVPVAVFRPTPEVTLSPTPEATPRPTPAVTPRPTPAVTPAAKHAHHAAAPASRTAVDNGQPVELQLTLTDRDFRHPDPNLDAEVLTTEAQQKVRAALVGISAKPDANLVVNGETEQMKDPYGNDNAAALRRIGNRRVKLVRAYMKRNMSKGKVNSRVTLGSDKGSPASIFQVVIH